MGIITRQGFLCHALAWLVYLCNYYTGLYKQQNRKSRDNVYEIWQYKKLFQNKIIWEGK